MGIIRRLGRIQTWPVGSPPGTRREPVLNYTAGYSVCYKRLSRYWKVHSLIMQPDLVCLIWDNMMKEGRQLFMHCKVEWVEWLGQPSNPLHWGYLGLTPGGARGMTWVGNPEARGLVPATYV